MFFQGARELAAKKNVSILKFSSDDYPFNSFANPRDEDFLLI